MFKAESAPQTHLPLPHTSQRRARRVRTTASARATDAHTHRPHKRGRLQRAHGGRGREGGGERQPGAARWSPRDGCGHHHSTRNDARGYTRTAHDDARRMRSNRMRRMAGGHTRTTGQGMEAPARPPWAAAQQSKAHHDAAGTRTRQYEEVHSATLDPHAEHDARRGATREHRTTQASGRHAEAIQPAGGPNHVDDTITTIATTMGRRVEKRRRRRCGQRTS